MIKQTILISMFLLFGCSLSAQKAFFVKPRIMMKTTRSFHFLEGFGVDESQINYAQNGYYSFVNHGHHFSDSKVNWGISAGMHFDDKNSLELVVSADGSSIKQSFHYYSQHSSFNQVVGSTFLWGREFFRINLEYNRKFLENSWYEARSILGAGVFLMHRRSEEFPSAEGNGAFTADVERYNYGFNNVAPILQLGVGMDFKTKRNVSLFSLDVFATLNFTTITQTVHSRVTLLDHTDNSIHQFLHVVSSRGSGINFQLSRPIQFYPWRPNKKEVL